MKVDLAGAPGLETDARSMVDDKSTANYDCAHKGIDTNTEKLMSKETILTASFNGENTLMSDVHSCPAVIKFNMCSTSETKLSLDSKCEDSVVEKTTKVSCKHNSSDCMDTTVPLTNVRSVPKKSTFDGCTPHSNGDSVFCSTKKSGSIGTDHLTSASCKNFKRAE